MLLLEHAGPSVLVDLHLRLRVVVGRSRAAESDLLRLRRLVV